MPSTYDIVSVVGARPQFVKLAPVARALAKIDSISHRVVHTGQHYDERMSAVFFDELALPRPDLDLEVGSGTHAAQTGAMLALLEDSFLEKRPNVVVVYGDTNSTLAATLAATKIHIPVAHIEAGLRSFNRSMPEEVNRLVADHCADRLYAPTPIAMDNLANENLLDRAVLSGDVMRDVVEHNRQLANRKSAALVDFDLNCGQFALLTVHRPSNTEVEVLQPILELLAQRASQECPIVFPAHPRARSLLDKMNFSDSRWFRVVEPLAYLDMLNLLENAALVVTDSGGVQKEAAFLHTPCITMRDETEWTETIEMGVNQLVGSDSEALGRAYDSVRESGDQFDESVIKLIDTNYGTGNAAELIAQDLSRWCSSFDE